ncbi:MAG: hypothetical protein AAFX99_27125, partial [Myxococcota bacterium]
PIYPKDDEQKEQYRKYLQGQATLKIVELTYRFAGLEMPNDLKKIPAISIAKNAPKLEKEVIEKGKVEVVVSVSLEDLEKSAYELVLYEERTKKEAAEKGQDKATDKAAPKDDDGARDKAEDKANTASDPKEGAAGNKANTTDGQDDKPKP